MRARLKWPARDTQTASGQLHCGGHCEPAVEPNAITLKKAERHERTSISHKRATQARFAHIRSESLGSVDSKLDRHDELIDASQSRRLPRVNKACPCRSSESSLLELRLLRPDQRASSRTL